MLWCTNSQGSIVQQASRLGFIVQHAQAKVLALAPLLVRQRRIIA